MGTVALAPILSALGTGLDLVGQGQARKETAKAQKVQKERDAFSALVEASGGATPGRPTPLGPLPTIDFGGAVSSLAGNLGNIAGASELTSFRDRQQAETERHNVATEAIGTIRANKTGVRGLTDANILNLLTKTDSFGQIVPLPEDIDGPLRAEGVRRGIITGTEGAPAASPFDINAGPGVLGVSPSGAGPIAAPAPVGPLGPSVTPDLDILSILQQNPFPDPFRTGGAR